MEQRRVPQPRPGSLNLDSDLPVGALIDDEPLEDAVPVQRLAGVGAALGSCFSVMVVVLIIGSAGSMSGPRAGLAAEALRDATSSDRQPSELAPEIAETPSRLAAGPVVPTEDREQIQSLRRAAMLARAEVQAAESRLALRRSDLERRALERAEQERARAEHIESSGSPYEWMTAGQLATRTRDRARSQLDADLDALRSLRAWAEAELSRLHEAADAAESALALATAEGGRPAHGATPGVAEPARAGSAVAGEARPAPTLDADLRSLIARHHARLIEPASIATAND